MASTLRPKGTVEVTCDHAGCGWSWWVDALDPLLPLGPWDCGQDHEANRVVYRALTRMRLETGIHWGTMLGRGPELAEGSCGSRSYRAGIAGVTDRYRDQQGVLEWSSLSDFDQIQVMVSNIKWGLAIEPGGAIGVPRNPYEAKPGHVQTVGYRWRGAEIREYTFVKCARAGCPHHIMVDYERPNMTCRGGASYEVGSWGGSERPEPKWWGTKHFRCEDGLSSFAPYPCYIVHGSDVLREFEKRGMRWTMWSPPPHDDAVGYVLFYDTCAATHGLLTYTKLPGIAQPIEFMSLSTLSRCIQWGNLRTLYAMIQDQCNDIAFELRQFVTR